MTNFRPQRMEKWKEPEDSFLVRSRLVVACVFLGWKRLSHILMPRKETVREEIKILEDDFGIKHKIKKMKIRG